MSALRATTPVPEVDEATPVVEVSHLSKVYEPFGKGMSLLLRSQISEPIQALTDVSFSVRAGEVCAIVGPNGAGKSTLFRVLTGLTTPSEGSARILGVDIASSARRVRRQIGFMPSDDRSLYLRHTCAENLAFHSKLQGLPKVGMHENIEETLSAVGLAHAADRAGFALSSGMRARLQLARALLHRPKVLILDEPTGTIDPVDAFHLLELLERLTREQNIAVLISSHRLEEIDALHDNVAFLDHGRLVHWGDLHSLRDMWSDPHVVVTFRDSRATTLAHTLSNTLDEVVSIEREDCTLSVTVKGDVGQYLSKLSAVLNDVVTMEQTRMPLREVLARLVDRPSAISKS